MRPAAVACSHYGCAANSELPGEHTPMYTESHAVSCCTHTPNSFASQRFYGAVDPSRRPSPVNSHLEQLQYRGAPLD